MEFYKYIEADSIGQERFSSSIFLNLLTELIGVIIHRETGKYSKNC